MYQEIAAVKSMEQNHAINDHFVVTFNKEMERKTGCNQKQFSSNHEIAPIGLNHCFY